MKSLNDVFVHQEQSTSKKYSHFVTSNEKIKTIKLDMNYMKITIY